MIKFQTIQKKQQQNWLAKYQLKTGAFLRAVQKNTTVIPDR